MAASTTCRSTTNTCSSAEHARIRNPSNTIGPAPPIAGERIRPVIDRVFPFDDLPAAKAYMESNAHLGKIVVRMDWGNTDYSKSSPRRRGSSN
ncbi:MAG: zinc-binding dehydrogenase [Betaproteobacteria bacterium]|nr:zinc-binding dehydrogenase [Betaproteobacteria bacterium]